MTQEPTQDAPRGPGGREPSAASGSESGARPVVRSIIDASGVLALLFTEPGAETVADAIADGAAVSAVNYSEVEIHMSRCGRDAGRILRPLREQLFVEAFTPADAVCAAALHPQTTRFGLSLADRACLALAKRMNATALTADSAWAQLNLGITISLIRRAEP